VKGSVRGGRHKSKREPQLALRERLNKKKGNYLNVTSEQKSTDTEGKAPTKHEPVDPNKRKTKRAKSH